MLKVHNYAIITLQGENTMLKKVAIVGIVILAVFSTKVLALTGSVSYNITEKTAKPIVVTLKTDEEIVLPTGWTKMDTTYTKEYRRNTEETLVIETETGDKAEVEIVINNIVIPSTGEIKLIYILLIVAAVMLSIIVISTVLRKGKRQKVSTKLKTIAAFFIIEVITLVGIWIYDDNRGEKMDAEIKEMLEEYEIAAAAALPNLEESTVEGELEEPATEVIEEQISVANYDVIGTIKIEKLQIEYPIITQTDETALKITVARIAGSGVNNVGNLVLVGHNMRNGRMFTNIGKLEKGEIIEITDTKLKTMQYKVYDRFLTEESNTDILSQETTGKKIITLITCSNQADKRIVVQAESI